MSINLTNQEIKIVNYLINKDAVYWEELSQFAKNPQSVKLKTIKKVVSEIKRKYISANLTIPFNVKLTDLSLKDKDIVNGLGAVYFDGMNALIETFNKDEVKNMPQNLVQVKRTPDHNVMVVTSGSNILPAHIDFVLDRNTKRVKTKLGYHKLNDSEWEMMKYFHTNVSKLITISELRDKVTYPQYGSKLPARWFDAIMRTVNNLRKQVPGLNNRLLTVKSTETSYLFQ